ncbi:hypothetical protein ACMC5O_001116 [Sphingomonas sediminicola]|uniref:hypothetical protein n=1 Tax=Sphingomonas sediminicola TaxID=386874 RepID=UPI003CE82D9F
MRKFKLVFAAAMLPLAACSTVGEGTDFGLYTLVRSKPTNVGNGSVTVVPPRPWNKQRRFFFFDSVRWVEDWTLNGPYLDGITFVTALPSGQYLIRQRKSDERQVPKFRSDMTAPEVAAMLETAFRVRGGAVDFRTLGLQPRQFLGYPGFQFDFEHLDNDELWRKGRAVGAVVEGRLYLILFDATRSHYYGNALPDFEVMANNARIRSS